MNIYKDLAGQRILMQGATLPEKEEFVKVNAHMHTPYSFSAFESIEQALDMAKSEGVKVAGINDFYATDGYSEWAKACIARNLFPLFNIEFISLNKGDQADGLRVNDPNNPGRTYISGKGLAFPEILDGPLLQKLESVKKESNHHVELMCAKLNEHLKTVDAPFAVSFEMVEDVLTQGSIRERHLAKALRLEVEKAFESESDQELFYTKIFAAPLKSKLNDFAGLENEIRGNLLKSGGSAFVPESAAAFLDTEVVRQIILGAGGIPTYPFLADFGNKQFTAFEEDKQKAADKLKERGFYSVELIPTRNTIEVLEEYSSFLWDNGFVVTFGTEHNTPTMEPVEVHVQKDQKLSAKMMEINYKGACVVAAHQYLVNTAGKGYVNAKGEADVENRDEYIKLGHAVITNFTK